LAVPPPGRSGVGLAGPRSIRPRSFPVGWPVAGPSGATPGLGGGVCLGDGDGRPAAGGFRSIPGGAASSGALPGVNLGFGVGLPLSSALPGAPGAGEALPAGDVPGLPGGVPFGGSVARGVAAGEVIPRGVAAGETARVGLRGEPAGVPAAAAGAVGLAPAAGGGLPAPRAAAPVGGGTFFGFSVLIFCFSCASF
jgi:hypothetical protein